MEDGLIDKIVAYHLSINLLSIVLSSICSSGREKKYILQKLVQMLMVLY